MVGRGRTMAGRLWQAVAVLFVLARATAVLGAANQIAIDEVLGSWQGDDSVQFIELRMLAPGQIQLSDGGGVRGTTELILDDMTGSATTRKELVFTKDVTHGETNARILIATEGLTTISGITPDFIMPTGFLPPRFGRVCYR